MTAAAPDPPGPASEPPPQTAADPGRPRLAALPETLLGPIVEAALDHLRAGKPIDVPVALKPLLAFDRRARQASALRRQVARALDAAPAVGSAVAAALAGTPAAVAALRTHDAADPTAGVFAAAARGDLDMHLAAVWAANPTGADIAIGACVAIERLDRVVVELERDRADWERRAAAADEAARRAELATVEERARADRFGAELRDERSGRRRRDESTEAQEAAAHRRAESAEAVADEERARATAATARATAEAERNRKLVEELGAARAELTAALEQTRGAVAADRVHEAARRAADLARDLSGMVDGTRSSSAPGRGSQVSGSASAGSAGAGAAAKRREGEPGRVRRPRPAPRGGLLADTPKGLASMLALPGLVLVVDGYNAAFSGWPDASAADQREHLARALHHVHGRFGCEVICVFDGDGTEGVKPLRRDGLRVLFSAADEEADTVVVRIVAQLPPERSAVVVSSDRWVAEHAEAAGATAVGSPTLVALSRTRSH